MIPGSHHTPLCSARHKHERLAEEITNLNINIIALTKKQRALLEIANSSLYLLRSTRIKQRSDLICIGADLENSVYYLASTEFEAKYYANLTIWNRFLPRKAMYTLEMMAHLWDLLVLALRHEENIEFFRDDTHRLARDFSNSTFRKLRFRMWCLHINAKRLVRLMRKEIQQGQKAAKKVQGSRQVEDALEGPDELVLS